MPLGLRYETLTDEELARLNEELAKKDTLDVIRWAYEEWQDELVYACSFGAEAMVLIDLISRVKPDARLIFLDTGLHFPETYQLIDRVKKRYPSLRIEMIEPELSLKEQEEKYGEKLWEKDPDLCCRLRKVVPMEKALKGAVAWLSGLRREQSPTRAHVQYVNRDNRFKSIKVCPLILWSWEDVWMYIRTFDLPYNVLHDQNYPSIGCAPCTRPVAEGEDHRAGRWAHTGKTECGLHVDEPSA